MNSLPSSPGRWLQGRAATLKNWRLHPEMWWGKKGQWVLKIKRRMAMLDGKGQIQLCHKGLWPCEFSAGTLLHQGCFQEDQIQMRKGLEEQLKSRRFIQQYVHTTLLLYESSWVAYHSLSHSKKKRTTRHYLEVCLSKSWLFCLSSFQNPPGQGPDQPQLSTWPCFEQEVEPGDFQQPFSPQTYLCYCEDSHFLETPFKPIKFFLKIRCLKGWGLNSLVFFVDGYLLQTCLLFSLQTTYNTTEKRGRLRLAWHACEG